MEKNNDENVVGFNVHRHNTNPKEKILHDNFKKEFLDNKYSTESIDRLVFGHGNNSHVPNDYLTDREKKILISGIQWLGSPVGELFLKDCGFIEMDNNFNE